MSFHGLPIWQTAALALAVGAVVLAMYSMRWRMPQRIVSTTALWTRVLARGRGAGRLGQLEHLVSMLLQLAIGLLLVLAVGQPRFGCQSKAGRAVVLVLDASPSMATVERVETRFELARRRALSRIESSATSDELGLVLAGGAPQVLAPLGRNHALLQRAIGAATLRFGSGTLADAVQRACSLLGGGGGSIAVITDGFEDPGACDGATLELVIVGSPRPNVGITAFAAAIPPHDALHGTTFIRVENAWSAPVSIEVRLDLDGKLLQVWPLELDAGKEAHRSFDGLPLSETGLLEARLAKIHFADNATDALKEDDHAYAVLAQRPRTPIDLIGSNEPLRLALESNTRYAVSVRQTLEEARAPIKVVIGTVTSTLREGRYLLVNPRGQDLPFQDKGVTIEPKITRWDDRHPILRRAVLSDLYVNEARTLVIPPAATAIVSSLSTPLIFALDDGKLRLVTFGFDLDQTNLPLRVGFPVLVYNAIDWLLDARDAAENARGFHVASGIDVIDPSNRTTRHDPVNGFVPVPEGEVGFYRARTSDGRPLPAVAVSVSSHVETIGAAKQATATPAAAGRVRDREGWIWFLLVALVLLVVEWVTYHRRVTV